MPSSVLMERILNAGRQLLEPRRNSTSDKINILIILINESFLPKIVFLNAIIYRIFKL